MSSTVYAQLNGDANTISTSVLKSDNHFQKEYIHKVNDNLKVNLYVEEVTEEESEEKSTLLLFTYINLLVLEPICLNQYEAYCEDFTHSVTTEPLFIRFCSLKIPS